MFLDAENDTFSDGDIETFKGQDEQLRNYGRLPNTMDVESRNYGRLPKEDIFPDFKKKTFGFYNSERSIYTLYVMQSDI